MSKPVPIDLDWLVDHPLPVHPHSTDKNTRGHVLAVGGSRTVPGGLRLTGEAALRAGAGKLRLATIECLAIPLGIAVPEAGIVSLPEGQDGEIDANATSLIVGTVQSCDCLVLGPAMTSKSAAATILEAVLHHQSGLSMVMDAAAISAAAKAQTMIENNRGRFVLTPNGGELAGLLGVPLGKIESDPESAVLRGVDATGAVVILKGPTTLMATPQGDLLAYSGGGVGMATGGSGDVLAGILGGLLARGLRPLDASAWAIWLHGEAGRRLAEQGGPIGFLSRELLPLIPALMRARQ